MGIFQTRSRTYSCLNSLDFGRCADTASSIGKIQIYRTSIKINSQMCNFDYSSSWKRRFFCIDLCCYLLGLSQYRRSPRWRGWWVLTEKKLPLGAKPALLSSKRISLATSSYAPVVSPVTRYSEPA